MKWSIAGLLASGVIAALGAAVLVATLRAGSRRGGEGGEVEVLVAARELPRSKMLDADCLATKVVPRKDAPDGFLSNAVQVVGKVLAVPVKEGQPFTKGCFASEGSGYRVASVLPEGMRAVTLSLLDHEGLYGLLYAGCTVDVLASFRVSRGIEGEALSTPLIQGIQVLAVEDETLVSGDKEPSEARKRTQSQSRLKRLLVTLMVTVEQATTLQLAMQYGSVSLALRNPLDTNPVAKQEALLSQLAKRGLTGLPDALQKLVESLAPPRRAAAEERGEAGEDGVERTAKERARPPAEPQWKVTVIRGGEVTTQSIPLPQEIQRK
ncbi:MAG: Flp pilus assembly protein CpaB [Planctomycetes bacterium]|nr:Flp pilus assembly protein CpaB [Planctomycetota bacterium]